MIRSLCISITRKMVSDQFLRNPFCCRSLQLYQLKQPKCQDKMEFSFRCFHGSKINNYSILDVEQCPVAPANYGSLALRSIPEYKETFFDENVSLSLNTMKDFQKYIVDFIEVCASQDLPYITDPSLDNVVSNLLANLENFSDKEIFAIMFFMTKFPAIRDFKDPKYMNIWKKLDDECYRRLPHLDLDTVLQVNDLFFRLKLNKRSLFHWNAVKRLLRRADTLSKVHFVRLMLCISCSPRMHPNINIYPLEFNLQRLIESMSAEEIAIVAEGFNKVPYSIKDKNFLATILSTIAKEPNSISSQGLIQVSRLINSSAHFRVAPAVYEFQESFVNEMDRLSTGAAVALGSISARVLNPHEELIQRIISKMTNNFKDLSIHEIAKLCDIISTLGTNCDDLCHIIADDLRTTKLEQLKLPHNAHHLPAIVNFLCMKGFIFEDLIVKILSTEFLTLCYDNVMYRFKQELLICDLTAAIELKNYQGPRLTEKQRGYLLKVYMFWLNWLPLPPKKAEPEYKRFIRSFTNAAERFLGGAQFMHVTNILPQFEFADAVICTDPTGRFIKIPKCYLTANDEHLIKLLPDANEIKDINFHAIMMVSRSGCLYNSHRPKGQVIMQRRQIEQLGYTTHLVFTLDWLQMDDTQRDQFLVDFFNRLQTLQTKNDHI